MTNPFYDIPHSIMKDMRHVIQDSGLFTLMFGSQKGAKDERLIETWYDALVRYTNDNAKGVTMVEVDCQKVLSPQKAWELRYRLRQDCPHNRIINVFHLEDGIEGLNRLIDFTDYIAVSVPELRIAGKANFIPSVVRYIKKKKPSIDIHLLGCTERKLLQACARYATSSDSTTYTCPLRYGFLNSKHIRSIKYDEVRDAFPKAWDVAITQCSKENAAAIILSIYKYLREYNLYAGPQN